MCPINLWALLGLAGIKSSNNKIKWKVTNSQGSIERKRVIETAQTQSNGFALRKTNFTTTSSHWCLRAWGTRQDFPSQVCGDVRLVVQKEDHDWPWIWKGLLLESGLMGITQEVFAIKGLHRRASEPVQQGEVKEVAVHQMEFHGNWWILMILNKALRPLPVVPSS